ncbi:MAG: carboxypeptidase-like regulatory domain-containing protein [Acidobacteriales bacterium]|nr:carboxypeptidase-like regulatory domain-containing protein [Terriglobales bacterium]
MRIDVQIARVCVLGLGISTCWAWGGQGHEKPGKISGSVFDNVNAVVPGTILNFKAVGAAGETVTVSSGPNGSYRTELPAGEYYLITKKHGFCSFQRSSFRIVSRANPVLNVRIQPCGIADGFRRTPEGELTEFAESVPRQDYDAFTVQDAPSSTLKLTVRFAERRKQGEVLEYTSVGTGPTKAPVVVTYDLLSVTGDKVVVNTRTNEVAAEGNVIVEDGAHWVNATSANIQFRLGKPVLTYVVRP